MEPSSACLSMVSIIGFSQNLGQFIFFYTELGTSLGAIARITEYTTELQPEDEPPATRRALPTSEWPSRGEIRFEHVTAHYDPTHEPVLKDISLEIPGGSFVGITGRTGSAKSSLVLTVLRLLSPSSGRIIVDGIDISTLPGEFLRSKVIVTIPQDPYFPADRSVRRSLLGSGDMQADDGTLVDVLDRVGLLPHMLEHVEGGPDPTQLPQKTVRVLDTHMADLPLSAGQQQLFSLAHALLQPAERRRVVVLDEVTSVLDRAAEDRLRDLLREGLSVAAPY